MNEQMNIAYMFCRVSRGRLVTKQYIRTLPAEVTPGNVYEVMDLAAPDHKTLSKSAQVEVNKIRRHAKLLCKSWYLSNWHAFVVGSTMRPSTLPCRCHDHS